MMKNPWIRSLQLGMGAALLGLAGLASAQPAPPADAAPPAPPAAAHKAHPHHHKHHAGPKGAARGPEGRDPARHEAAAVKEQSRRGGIESGEHFQRNAMARCDVFKNEADHRSCVDRLRSGQVSGSVEGGGVLREYTEQVPVQQ